MSSTAKQSSGAYKDLITWQHLTQENIANYGIAINLCGYNIGQKRLNRAVKNKILSSRIETINKLIQLIG